MTTLKTPALKANFYGQEFLLVGALLSLLSHSLLSVYMKKIMIKIKLSLLTESKLIMPKGVVEGGEGGGEGGSEQPVKTLHAHHPHRFSLKNVFTDKK